MTTIKKICRVYGAEVSDTLHRSEKILWDIASEFYGICQDYTGPINWDLYDGLKESDDFFKEAANFQVAYEQACRGEWASEWWSGKQANDIFSFLFIQIDMLLSGVHTFGDNVRLFVQDAPDDLLDLIFEWDGVGNLYAHVEKI